MTCRCAGGDRCGMGRVTGQLAGTARWAGELAAGGLVLGVGADGLAAVQLAVMIAAAIATSWAARFMQIIVGHGGAVWKGDGPALFSASSR
jgi:hypothetical protein